MKWDKKGLIYRPNAKSPWAINSALTPTPILINEEIIRIYAGFRDNYGVSRIGYVDLEAENPKSIVGISNEPILDIGPPGAFDDNGVILGDVVKFQDKFYMYYVGFQLVKKVKFLAYSGLAISSDGGETFQRYSFAPILDRCKSDNYIAAIHSVMIEDNIWKVWYASGNGWQNRDNRPYPQYHIRYLESKDGIHFQEREKSKLCIDVVGKEYRIGRPRVYKNNGIYIMLYTKGTIDGEYLPGYAESIDGINWARKDKKIGFTLSDRGWDSIHLCYPSLLTYKEKTYAFYNGNNMGAEGFGYAELISW